MIKSIVVRLLNTLTYAYLKRGKVRVVVVVGSVGKTTTAAAMRTVLSQKYTVHIPQNAYNTDKSIHLAIFQLQFGTSVVSWLRTMAKLLARSFGRPNFEYVVLELGTDRPGDIEKFAWLKPEIAIVTAVAPEHMEAFHELEAVAREELSVHGFAKRLYVSADSVDRQWLVLLPAERYLLFGTNTPRAVDSVRYSEGELRADIVLEQRRLANIQTHVVGKHMMQAILAALSVAADCGLSDDELRRGAEMVRPVAGRMQILKGKLGCLIIDDSYNASPAAVAAGLQTLYELPGSLKIAILGSMNELGAVSAQAHAEVGMLCDPAQLALVVTIGEQANLHTAPAAEKQGCKVVCTNSPYAAGKIVLEQLTADSIVLVKGSQNGVFSEESIKILLADQADVQRLVRQSDYWMRRKHAQFPQGQTQEKSD